MAGLARLGGDAEQATPGGAAAILLDQAGSPEGLHSFKKLPHGGCAYTCCRWWVAAVGHDCCCFGDMLICALRVFYLYGVMCVTVFAS